MNGRLWLCNMAVQMLILSMLGLAFASPPDAQWRTIETEHYRVHFPVQVEAWATQAASRLESMHARVEGQVGYQMTRTIDVIVRDPVASANGMALPLLRGPRMELWVTPPGADSVIGWNRRWDEGLIVHEAAHLVHMGRPSRGGLDGVLDGVVGVGPVARKSPRWVLEGFATVVEGDQTGFGRPFSDQQASELRRMAREGTLPAYGELDGNARWRGGGFAYQVGSAFLIWLRHREGPDSLRALWTRLTAVKFRSFDEAFEGVFGDEPAVLYGRFTAEITRDAMLLETALPVDEGTRFVDLRGSVGAPAVSPNGENLALVRVDDGRAILEVRATSEDDERLAERAEERVEAAELDPEDVADPIADEPLLKVTFTRSRRDRGPSGPRWIDDESLLFVGGSVDRAGRVRTDVFRLQVDTGVETRLTRWQDLRDVDPAPDGTWAVAAQWAWGASGIVRVDLSTGQVTPIVASTVSVVHDNPRVSPDGLRIAWLQMAEDRWRLMVREPDGVTRQVPTPAGASLAHPAWKDDSTLIVAGSLHGLQEVWAVPVDGGEVSVLTHSHGGASAPEPALDHLYYLDSDSRGRDVHRVSWPTQPSGPLSRSDLPALPDTALVLTPTPPTVALPEAAPVESSAYGLGRFEGRGLISSTATTGDSQSIELGYRGGDIVGRHELLVLGAWGSRAAARGGRATWALRSLPVTVQLGAFAAWDGNSDEARAGAELEVRDAHRWNNGVLRASVGGIADPSIDAQAAYLAYGDMSLVARTGGARFFTVELGAGGTGGVYGSGSGAILRGRGALWLGSGRALGVAGRWMQRTGDAPSVELGGVTSSVLPPAWQRHRLQSGAWNQGTLSGDVLVSMSAHMGNPVQLSVERTQLVTFLGWSDRGATLVDLSVRRRVPAQPLVKLPATRLHAGVGCRVETPGEGVRRKPCTVATDWVGWVRAAWSLD